MFRWYENAELCYAYLSDVFDDDSERLLDTNRKLGENDVKSPNPPDEGFYRSQWFSRGWTLQELLAPDLVVFFNRSWRRIGTKSSLSHILRRKTGIKSFTTYKSACIAQKMSWAAGRATTKVEDRAYSLMGIMGVSMPLVSSISEGYSISRLIHKLRHNLRRK